MEGEEGCLEALLGELGSCWGQGRWALVYNRVFTPVCCVSYLCEQWSHVSVVSFEPAVEGGHRAIIFSRVSGVGKAVYAEGLHFR